MESTGLRRDEEWLLNHMIDPVAIAPGVRTEQDRAPRSAMGRFGAQAVVAYLRRSHAGIAPPPLEPSIRLAAMTYASTCVVCHRISGEGGTVGPDLTVIGKRRDAAGIREVIEDASMVYGESSMPSLQGQADRRANRGAGRLPREPEVARYGAAGGGADFGSPRPGGRCSRSRGRATIRPP